MRTFVILGLSCLMVFGFSACAKKECKPCRKAASFKLV